MKVSCREDFGGNSKKHARVGSSHISLTLGKVTIASSDVDYIIGFIRCYSDLVSEWCPVVFQHGYILCAVLYMPSWSRSLGMKLTHTELQTQDYC